MLKLSNKISIPDNEIELTAIRAQGAGGQNVNKVATAIHLRFDITASSLPEEYKQRLLALHDHRVSSEGIVVIKAQRYRSQEKNRDDALQRLQSLIQKAMQKKKKRIPTKVAKAAKQKRLDEKSKRGKTKALRRPVQKDFD